MTRQNVEWMYAPHSALTPLWNARSSSSCRFTLPEITEAVSENELETYQPTHQQTNTTRQKPTGQEVSDAGSHSLILSTDSRVMVRWKDPIRRQRTRTTDVKSTIAVYITTNRSTSPKNIVTARSGQRVATPDSGIGGDKSFEQMVIFLHGITESSGPSLRCTTRRCETRPGID